MARGQKFVALNFLVLIASCFVSLTLAEGLVRWRYPEFGIPVREHRLFTEPDPLLGWRKIPNFRGMHFQSEYSVVERINSKGIRGPEYSYEKGSNEFRILILGDSFAEGYMVEFEHLFSEVLQRMLNATFERSVEVINAGTGGYSTDQELLYFLSEGRKYDPDLTVLMFYYNDPPYNVRSAYWRGEKPLFTVHDGVLELSRLPRQPPDSESRIRTSQTSRPFSPADPSTWHLTRFLVHSIQMLAHSETSPGGPILIADGESTTSAAIDPDLDAQQDVHARGDNQVYMWKLTEAILRRLKEEVESAGSQLLIFYVPYRFEVYDRAWQVGTATSHYLRNLEIIARRNTTALINPLRAFRERARDLIERDEFLYYRLDEHWNPRGNELVGRVLAQYIEAHCEDYGICREPRGTTSGDRSQQEEWE